MRRRERGLKEQPCAPERGSLTDGANQSGSGQRPNPRTTLPAPAYRHQGLPACATAVRSRAETTGAGLVTEKRRVLDPASP